MAPRAESKPGLLDLFMAALQVAVPDLSREQTELVRRLVEGMLRERYG